MINDNPNCHPVEIVMKDKAATTAEKVVSLLRKNPMSAKEVGAEIGMSGRSASLLLRRMRAGDFGEMRKVNILDDANKERGTVWAARQSGPEESAHLAALAGACPASFWIPRFNERAA